MHKNNEHTRIGQTGLTDIRKKNQKSRIEQGKQSLPANVRTSATLSTFRRHLKSHLFQSSFPTA